MDKSDIKVSTIAYGILCGYLLIKLFPIIVDLTLLAAIFIAEDIIRLYEFLLNALNF